MHDYLDSLTARQQSDLSGVRDRLAIMAESDVGPWLDPTTRGAERFDLLEAAAGASGRVLQPARPTAGRCWPRCWGRRSCRTCRRPSRRCRVDRCPTLVVIDEFSAVAAEQVARLFGRARSAGMSLLLGTQELSDLRLAGHETLLEQVLGNLACLIAHRQVVPDSAELIARLAGTRGAWHTTKSSDGKVSRTRTREYLIDPDEVRGLARGHAAVIRLTERGRVAIARMFPPAGRR